MGKSKVVSQDEDGLSERLHRILGDKKVCEEHLRYHRMMESRFRRHIHRLEREEKATGELLAVIWRRYA